MTTPEFQSPQPAPGERTTREQVDAAYFARTPRDYEPAITSPAVKDGGRDA